MERRYLDFLFEGRRHDSLTSLFVRSHLRQNMIFSFLEWFNSHNYSSSLFSISSSVFQRIIIYRMRMPPDNNGLSSTFAIISVVDKSVGQNEFFTPIHSCRTIRSTGEKFDTQIDFSNGKRIGCWISIQSHTENSYFVWPWFRRQIKS